MNEISMYLEDYNTDLSSVSSIEIESKIEEISIKVQELLNSVNATYNNYEEHCHRIYSLSSHIYRTTRKSNG